MDATATAAEDGLQLDREALAGLTPNERELLHYVVGDYLDGRMQLPSLPSIAADVRRAVRDPQMSPHDVARLVQADPATAVHLIRVVNSPLFRGYDTIDSVLEAVVRLGQTRVQSLVTLFTVRQMLQTRSPLLQRLLDGFWQHSQMVAASAYYIAEITPGMDRETALMAGLLHDIGTVPVLQQVDRHDRLVASDAELGHVVDHLKGPIGALLLERWKFSAAIVTAAREAELWERDSPEADYCDIVIMAQLHSFIGTPRMASLPRIDRVPAFRKLALGELTPQMSLQVIADANRRIAEIQASLFG